jgi:hypothetical protein
MYYRIHSGHRQGFLKILNGGQIKEGNGGGKTHETFSVHFNMYTPFLNNFENRRSPSKMKPCTMRGPEKGKAY